jgi:hypothetical protein
MLVGRGPAATVDVTEAGGVSLLDVLLLPFRDVAAEGVALPEPLDVTSLSPAHPATARATTLQAATCVHTRPTLILIGPKTRGFPLQFNEIQLILSFRAMNCDAAGTVLPCDWRSQDRFVLEK